MENYKKLFKNSIIFGIGNFGSKLINIILVPFYTYYLSVSEYGVIDLSLTTLNMLLPLITLSLYDAVLRFVMDKTTNFSNTLKSTLMFISMVNIFILLVLIIIKSNEIIMLTSLILLLQSYQTTLSQYARAIGNSKLFALVGIMMTFITAITNILMIAVLKWGISGYFLSLIIANFCAILYLFFRLNVPKIMKEGIFDFSLLKKMIKYSIPLIPNSLMWWLTNASGRYFILVFLGPVQNGLFAVATKIPTILSMFTNVFSQAWQLSAIEEYDSESKSEFYSNVMRYYFLVLLLGSSGILIILKPLFSLVFSAEYYNSWEPVPFLLISIVFLSLCSFLGTNYIAAKETKGVFKTTLVSGIVNVVLNLALTPILGIIGTAISTMISYIILFFYRLVDTRKFVSIKINKKIYIISLLVFSCQTLTLFFVENIFVSVTSQVILFSLNIIVFYKDIVLLFRKRGKK